MKTPDNPELQIRAAEVEECIASAQARSNVRQWALGASSVLLASGAVLAGGALDDKTEVGYSTAMVVMAASGVIAASDTLRTRFKQHTQVSRFIDEVKNSGYDFKEHSNPRTANTGSYVYEDDFYPSSVLKSTYHNASSAFLLSGGGMLFTMGLAETIPIQPRLLLMFGASTIGGGVLEAVNAYWHNQTSASKYKAQVQNIVSNARPKTAE